MKDADSAGEFIRKRLQYNFFYNEFFAVRLAWEYAAEGDLKAVAGLEAVMEAGKIPRETREASRKLGARFVKTLSGISVSFKNEMFSRYREMRKGKSTHHAVAYGVFCQSAGITEQDCLEHFLYAQTSAMVTNCVKTVPLSQSAGQKLLAETYGLLENNGRGDPGNLHRLAWAFRTGFRFFGACSMKGCIPGFTCPEGGENIQWNALHNSMGRIVLSEKNTGKEDKEMSYVKIGVAGPVGSGKTALIECLTRKMASEYSIGVITNDIYTKEDAEFLCKNSVLPRERIIGVETGGCPSYRNPRGCFHESGGGR